MSTGEETLSTDDSGADDRFRTLGVCLGAALLGFLGMQFWGLILISLIGGVPLTETQELVINPPINGLGMITGAVVFLELSDRGPSFLDLRTPRLRDVGYVVGGTVFLFVMVQIIGLLFSFLQISPADHGTADAIRDADPVIVAFLIFGAFAFIGPGEELLFRNVVQKRLYDDFSRYGAIGFASVIFALIHYSAYATGTFGQAIASLATVFSLSLMLGWVYHRTDSVVVPALIHGAYDAVTFVIIYLGAG